MTDKTNGESGATERKPGRWLWLIGFLCAMAVGLPFLNKPIHIDDTVVLAVSKQIVKHPLRPLDFNFHWFDDLEPIYPKTDNPPFLSYWLAPVYAIFGANEIALHVWMLPFLLLFAFAMGTLSRRFTNGSVWPLLIVLLSPAVVVSGNIMRDVPAAAMATAAVALFVTGTDRDRWGYVLAGGLLAGIAVVTKYSAVILMPVMAVYPLMKRKPKYLFGLLFGAAIPELWLVHNYFLHDKLHILAIKEDKADLPYDWKDKLAAAMVITGASFLLFPALAVGAARRREGAVPSIAAAAAVLTMLLLIAHHLPRLSNYVRPTNVKEHVWGMMQYDLWAMMGAMVVVWTIGSALFASGRWLSRDPEPEALDSLFLLWWMIGPYFCGVFFVGFPAVRHVLPAAAPIALLAVRYAQRGVAPRDRWVAAAFGVAIMLQAALAFWTSAADYGYADSYRRVAREVVEEFKTPEGNEIWFSGHWGWQHYAAEAGMKPITRNIVESPGAEPKPAPAPKAGDIVVEPQTVHKGAMPGWLYGRLEPIKEIRVPANLGMTVMDWAYASFYNTSGTAAPMRFVKGKPYEVFKVYRVKPE